jgi:glycosyltransferase involved in cell wall biosynthesis
MILFFVKGFDQIKLFYSNKQVAKTNFSLIIPFRNEALNLPDLLQSISSLQYSKDKFEVLLINDGSKDGFDGIIKDFKQNNIDIDITVLNNIRKGISPKKDAITLGIRKSKYDWIVTTDADCILPVNWLITFDGFIQKEAPVMVAGPVTFQTEKSFLYSFQVLDLLSLQGSTIGGFGMGKPFMCNGANLFYSKRYFDLLEGFSGNDSIASGDDIFLLEKMIRRYPDKVKYLKSDEVIVRTKPENNIMDLIQQRIRWASKTGSYNNGFGKLIGIVVFTTNLLLITLLIMSFFNKFSWQYLGLFFLLKFNLDFILLYKTATFFKQEHFLKNYFVNSFLYPFFIVYVALLSFNGTYYWKGRKFMK